MISIVDSAYIAGFIDGEGCVSLQATIGKGRSDITFRASVDIVSTDKHALVWIKDRCGGSIYTRKSKNRRHKDAHFLRIAKKDDLLALLEAIYPFLLIKNKQASILMELLRSRTKKKNKHGKKELVATEKIRKLNKRGR